MEHRSVHRYRISLPISFFWGTGSNPLAGSGISRDLSIHGAFVLSPDTVLFGSDIRLKVLIPAIREGSKGAEMQGTGRVVRVEPEGFAVEAAIGFSNQPHRKKELINRSIAGTRNEADCLGTHEAFVGARK